LGKGAFSTVRIGTHLTSGDQFALKIVPKSKVSSSKKSQDAIINEIAIMRTFQGELAHENVICMSEYVEDEFKHVFVLELLEGGELFDRFISMD